MPNPHKWVTSTLGHGDSMCKYCSITNMEAAVLGELDHCDKAPEPEPMIVPDVPMGLSTNVGDWPYFPIPMPLTADGQGPATLGEDAATMSYQVWDWTNTSHGEFEHLSDAIELAMKLSLGAGS